MVRNSFLALVILGTLSCTGPSVKIDSQKTGELISPLLFGHNLEHTRRAIWQGISAEMVANRKFAAVNEGLPARWFQIGDGGHLSIDKTVAYAGKQSLRLEIDQGHLGIGQEQEGLAFQKDRKYVLRIWTKSKANRNLRIKISNKKSAETLLNRETQTGNGEWQLWTGEFKSPSTTTDAHIEIGSNTPGVFWLGALSMMPADNFYGMRRDVVALLKTIKPGSMRWPGGCFAEYYCWEDGLLPRDKRPPLGPAEWEGLLPDTDGYDNHEIGIDEFMALCREIDAEPVITIRYGQGSPKEASSWVEYCNGESGTKWGKIRNERGHTEPYRVKYWYVGNEIWGISLVRNKDPEVCARISAEFARAMKETDPSIRLIGVAPSHDPELWPLWHKPLLTEAGEYLDLVQHGYYLRDPEEASMERMVKAPTEEILPSARSLLRYTDEVLAGKKSMGLAFYEWNVYWGREGDVVGGIFAAGMLNMFCRKAAALGLELAGYFQPISEGAIKVEPFGCQLEPDGQVFALYSVHQGNRLLELPAAKEADADIDLCASMSPDKREVYITLLNRDLEDESEVKLSLANFPEPVETSLILLVPQTLELKEKSFQQFDQKPEVVKGKHVNIKLPRCSIALVHLSFPENSQ